MEIFFEIHTDLPRESPGGNEYTKKAWQILPPLIKPDILDIGCGPGEQTLELAKLSQGKIIAIDTYQPYLDSLKLQASQVGLANRITCLNQTMFKLPFSPETFDVIWAEGSIYIIGFEEGLKQWYPLLKQGGYLVVSELVWLKPDQPREIKQYWQQQYPGMQTIEQVHQIISLNGYNLYSSFTLPQQAWWNYYLPLETRINHLCSLYRGDPALGLPYRKPTLGNVDPEKALTILANEKEEIEMYRKYYQWYGYNFFVIQKP